MPRYGGAFVIFETQHDPVSESRRYSDVLGDPANRACASHSQRQNLLVASEIPHEILVTVMDGQQVGDVLRYR